MYTLHGFVTINSLVNNEKDVVSPLGELGADSASYARDKGYYTNPDVPNIRLVSFRSQDDNTIVTVPAYAANNCISLSKWLSTKALSGYFINDRATVLQAINAEFRGVLNKVKIGKMINGGNNVFLPEYIEFVILNQPDNKIKLWFADASFAQQYPYYDVVVIPVVENLDDYFGEPADVLKIQPGHLMKSVHERANVLRERSPYTKIFTFNYDWYNPLDTSVTKEFPWTVIIYGNIGENMDIIKDKITEYVLAHSAYDRQRWEKIFPDLFVPTEFTISPFWTRYSVPNHSIVAGMFSPTMKYADLVDHAKKTMVTYPASHIEAKLELSSSLYKSISFEVLGHPQNRLTSPSFYETWNEYALMRSVSDDFNRFGKTTQDFIRMTVEMLRWADEATLDTALPEGYTRVKRGDIWYLSKNHNRVTYLCVMRLNWEENGALYNK